MGHHPWVFCFAHDENRYRVKLHLRCIKYAADSSPSYPLTTFETSKAVLGLCTGGAILCVEDAILCPSNFPLFSLK